MGYNKKAAGNNFSPVRKGLLRFYLWTVTHTVAILILGFNCRRKVFVTTLRLLCAEVFRAFLFEVANGKILCN